MVPIGSCLPGSIHSICFVCTGNICRSPTAEVVLRSKVDALRLQHPVVICSAGIHDYHIGEPPDSRSMAAAARRGYDLSSLHAKQFGPDDFDRFDLVLALDRGHLVTLQRLAGPSLTPQKIHLATCCAKLNRGKDVPDPYYGERASFDLVLDMLEDAAEGLCELLVNISRSGH